LAGRWFPSLAWHNALQSESIAVDVREGDWFDALIAEPKAEGKLVHAIERETGYRSRQCGVRVSQNCALQN
jgi:hypothetical protein